MRLLVIGHTYITTFAQSKYVAMKDLDPALHLEIITPTQVPHVFMRHEHKRHPKLSADETITIPILLGSPPSTYIFSPLRLRQVMRDFQPDVIHIEEDPHSFIGLESVWLARRACPQAKISFFIWDNLARQPRFPINLFKTWATRYALNRAQLVICGNREAQQLLKTVKHYPGASAVMPQLGLDENDYRTPPAPATLAKLRGGTDQPLIGFIGRLAPEKGVRVLLEALAQLQDLAWRLVVIGEGSLRQEIETQWQTQLGKRLLYLPAVPHNQVADYIKCLDIFVLASYGIPGWKEQFGVTLAQAMMAGVACIGSSSGAIPEVLDSSGMIVPENNREALAHALCELICSPAQRQVLGQHAKEIAWQHYTNRTVAQSQLAEIKKLIPSKM